MALNLKMIILMVFSVIATWPYPSHSTSKSDNNGDSPNNSPTMQQRVYPMKSEGENLPYEFDNPDDGDFCG